MDKKIEPTDAMVEAGASSAWEEVNPGILGWNSISERHKEGCRRDARAVLTAALNHPDTRGLIAGEDARPWEPLNEGDPVHVGDEVRRDHGGITRTAVVGWVDKSGDPWTADDIFIGEINIGTWYVRRTAPELPTKCGTVIVANDGHKFIKAEVDGIAHRAREAVLGANGWWYGAWRKAEGDGLLSAMFPEHISAPTWKVDDQ